MRKTIEISMTEADCQTLTAIVADRNSPQKTPLASAGSKIAPA
jgi:hypothetical protein